jgi:hypothetical protein
VTNVPAAKLARAAGLVLGQARWQIELLFKRWKSGGQIDEWRSAAPWRILCEVYAELLGLVVPHWLLVVSSGGYAKRSLAKAAQTIQQHSLHLAVPLDEAGRLAGAIVGLARCIATGARLNKRRTTPNTYQLLLDPSVLTLA